MKLTLREQVNVLFESYLHEEHNDTIYTKDDMDLAVQDESFQKLFLEFVEKNLC